METEYIEQIKKERNIKNAKDAESWIKLNDWAIEQKRKNIGYTYEAALHGASQSTIIYEVERLSKEIAELNKENAALEIIRKEYGNI